MNQLANYAARDRLRIHAVVGFVVAHLGALTAPFFFTWTGFACFIVVGVGTYLYGITVGYHRLLTHRSFRTSSFVEGALAFLGTMTLQGGPISWVAAHRYHHRRSDHDGDPHSPLAGFFWSHVVWICYRHPKLADTEARCRFAPDLVKKPILRFLENYYYRINVLSLVVFFGSGWLIGGLWMGISVLLWAVFLRLVCFWHITFLVNSASHRWGYRNFDTNDQSRNNWWVAMLALGEGWHNNHHAEPRSAAFGRRWFEVDFGYWGDLRVENVPID